MLISTKQSFLFPFIHFTSNYPISIPLHVELLELLRTQGSFADCINIQISRPPGTLTTVYYIPCPQHDLLHLSCSSFWLPWYFLSLSCRTVGASGSVFLKGVEAAAAEDHAAGRHAELSSHFYMRTHARSRYTLTPLHDPLLCPKMWTVNHRLSV